MATALITGVTGQDGSYLAELLISLRYEVHGIARYHSSGTWPRNLKSLEDNPKFHLHYGDVTDASRMSDLVNSIKPAEIYHLAAQSHVGESFNSPVLTTNSIVQGTLHMLELVKHAKLRQGRVIRMYNASTSEMYGGELQFSKTELTTMQRLGDPFSPKSPYAAAKVCAHQMVENYRQAYDLFVCNGILFNHESPRRPESFVTRKIAAAVARIKRGEQERLVLGSLEPQRDWGFAGDYVRAMHGILKYSCPVDWVIATGQTFSVGDFVRHAFEIVGLDWEAYVDLHPDFRRPVEVLYLCGDASAAKRCFGWEPSVRFPQLVTMMVNHELYSKERQK